MKQKIIFYSLIIICIIGCSKNNNENESSFLIGRWYPYKVIINDEEKQDWKDINVYVKKHRFYLTNKVGSITDSCAYVFDSENRNIYSLHLNNKEEFNIGVINITNDNLEIISSNTGTTGHIYLRKIE